QMLPLLLLSLLALVAPLPLPRNSTTVVPDVEPLINMPDPAALLAPTTEPTNTMISMCPKKLRIRKGKTTAIPSLIDDKECLCDCAECADTLNNGTDERITLRKGPNFYLTVNGKSANGQRLRRQCGCCG
ncbi:hypothetical protein PENTCL1PPCAC_25659, partial [Pristionchus entomophagus]